MKIKVMAADLPSPFAAQNIIDMSGKIMVSRSIIPMTLNMTAETVESPTDLSICALSERQSLSFIVHFVPPRMYLSRLGSNDALFIWQSRGISDMSLTSVMILSIVSTLYEKIKVFFAVYDNNCSVHRGRNGSVHRQFDHKITKIGEVKTVLVNMVYLKAAYSV